jgi:uncharacterized membrane protein
VELLALGLALALAIPFLLLIVSWVYGRRLEEVERQLTEQTAALGAVQAKLAALLGGTAEAGVGAEPAAAAPAPRTALPPPEAPRPAAPATATPPEAPPVPPAATPAPSRPAVEPPAASHPPVQIPAVPPHETPATPPALAADSAKFRPLPPPPNSYDRPSRPPDSPAVAQAPFDWEKLVGVKLFSAVAGIALVIGAIFFLKHSIDSGWLQPPVRVAIGLLVGIALLVACELKAARKYEVTANALDAAAIAILFATFFAAHSLWDLIPGTLTFALLGVVTALAVLLSIRRESLFIAVLGLLGGFATPALLSTGENQPIPLFSYLVLLNVGLAWVAYRQRWPLLTALTLVLTTVYQWGWVIRFLDASQVTLAMGIFLVFPILAVVGLMLARRGASDDAATFERTAALGAAAPLLFAVYLSAVPGYGARPWLLFGFLLLVDAGLLAIAIARGQRVLHAAGAAGTVAVMGIWLATAYGPAHLTPALVFTAAFTLFYALAPMAIEWGGRQGRPYAGVGEDRPYDEGGRKGRSDGEAGPDDIAGPAHVPADHAVYAAPLLLGALAALARMEPLLAGPALLFGTLLPLVVVLAWRAIASDRGGVFFVAAFFMFATQATWAATHLDADRVGTAVVVLSGCALAWLLVPALARRAGRGLTPAAGSGLVLFATLGLMLVLSDTRMAPEAPWAFAMLLVVLNAGLFVESAGRPLHPVSMAAGVLALIVLAMMGEAVAGASALTTLALVTGIGLAAMAIHAATHGLPSETPPAMFLEGRYPGLAAHLAVAIVALTWDRALPPWPWLGAMGVLTLGMSAASLATRTPSLHAAGAIAAAGTIAAWAGVAGGSWGLVAMLAAGSVVAYTLGWIRLSDRATGAAAAAVAAAAVLFLAEATTVLAASASPGPPFLAIAIAHVLFLSILLALTWRHGWQGVAVAALLPAAWAMLVQWDTMQRGGEWTHLLALAFAIYAVFTAYPLALGRRSAGARDPYLAAVLASALMFFAGRAALMAGGYDWLLGALPVAQAAVMAVLLRQLLRIQPAERDLGRLALVGGATLALITVAIPLQLQQQWITIGWALEGAALAWLYRRVPHRGLLFWAVGLLGAVFVRLAMNPSILVYEPRGPMRILNWYLYAYLICAAAFLLAAWWFSKTDDRLGPLPGRASQVLPAGAVVLLFLLLNIEIADFYATGRTVMFQFGASVSQDLTYTIGWLVFGMALLAACIYVGSRAGRIAALVLVALTTFKCFLFDLSQLEGLYRVGSFVGLALSLALISLALQKFVLARPEAQVQPEEQVL